MEAQSAQTLRSELKAGLAMHTGTTRWFRHWSPRFTYTGLPQSVGNWRGAVCKHLADHVDGGLMLGETNENYVGS